MTGRDKTSIKNYAKWKQDTERRETMQAGGSETLGSVVAPAQARGDGAPGGVGIPTQKSTLTVGHARGQGGWFHA